MPALNNTLTLDRCPHCSVNLPNLTLQARVETRDHIGHNQRTWVLYSCAKCGGATMAVAAIWGNEVSDFYPQLTVVDESLPAKARAFLQQGIDSLHAPAGAIMLTASAIDAMLKTKSYTDGMAPPIKSATEHSDFRWKRANTLYVYSAAENTGFPATRTGSEWLRRTGHMLRILSNEP